MRVLVLGWVVVGVWACRDVLRVREERAGDLAQRLADESPAIHAAFHSACPGHPPGHRPVCLRVLVSGGPPGYRVFAQACETAFHAAAAASRRFRLLFPLNHLPSCQGQDLKRHKRHGDQSYYAICLFKRGRRARRRKRGAVRAPPTVQAQNRHASFLKYMNKLLIAGGLSTLLVGFLVIGLMYLAAWSQLALTALWGDLNLPISMGNLTTLMSKHKMPDTLVLDWADNVDLPPTFWDDWNLTYAEFARCPPAAVTAMDFWDWGSTLATPPTPMETKDDENPLFNLALLIPYNKLVSMGLETMAQWRTTGDPQYDTYFIDDEGSNLLPNDAAPNSRRGKLGRNSSFLTRRRSSFLIRRFVSSKKQNALPPPAPTRPGTEKWKGKEAVGKKQAGREGGVAEAVSGVLQLEEALPQEQEESVQKKTARKQSKSRDSTMRSDSQLKSALSPRKESEKDAKGRGTLARPSDVTLDSHSGGSTSGGSGGGTGGKIADPDNISLRSCYIQS